MGSGSSRIVVIGAGFGFVCGAGWPAGKVGRPLGKDSGFRISCTICCAPVSADGENPAARQAARRGRPGLEPGAVGMVVVWQRHHTGLTALLKDGATLQEIAPGVTWRGDDIGRWLTRQQCAWTRVDPEQRKRLAVLGAEAVARPRKTGSGTARSTAAFTWGKSAPRLSRPLIIGVRQQLSAHADADSDVSRSAVGNGFLNSRWPGNETAMMQACRWPCARLRS